jgi:extracellular factor (EF) 3-hydroxypalmitic acid methyl ester biosynthesis protein
LKVLNLGSGPARDVYEVARAEKNIRFFCVDIDENAIAYAKNLCRGMEDRVSFIKANVLKLRTLDRFDVIWSAGLFDYFPDKTFVVTLRAISKYINETGKIIIGNFSRSNPSRYWMEAVGDWKLHHRTGNELTQLAVMAGIEPARVTIDAEPEGVNLFLHIAGVERPGVT